jgi:HEAT repeat protein
MFDFLRSKTPIEKLTKRLTETGGEDGPRIDAAQKLAEMDSPEATFALAKRFTISSKVITQDIEEKRMVVNMLAAKGDRAVEPLLRFLKSHHQVEWPVQALVRILPTDQLIPKLVDVLENVAQNPFTSPEHRSSLIKAMQGHVTPEIAAVLKKSLEDDDDDVCIATVHALAEMGEQMRETLLEAFVAGVDRSRVRIAIGEVFADRDWPVKGYRPTIEENLPAGFHITAKGLIRRKGSPA